MTLSPAAAAQAAADDNRLIFAIFLDYPGDPFRAVSLPMPVTFSGTGDTELDGFQFDPLADLGLGKITQDISGAPQSVSIVLSAVDDDEGPVRQMLIDILDANLWFRRRAVIWFGWWISETQQAVFAPDHLRFAGFLDDLPMEIDRDVSQVTATIISNAALIERGSTSRTTNEQQQSDFPGDTALSFISRLAAGEVLMNSNVPTPVNRGGGSAGDGNLFRGPQLRTLR